MSDKPIKDENAATDSISLTRAISSGEGTSLHPARNLAIPSRHRLGQRSRAASAAPRKVRQEPRRTITRAGGEAIAGSLTAPRAKRVVNNDK
jgi:hypothetical protein